MIATPSPAACADPVLTDVDAEAALQREVALHAFAWFVVSNAIGLWMALLLLAPELGSLMAPFTYGRWANLHLNLSLYGWCSVPLLGLLFRAYLSPRAGRGPRVALQAWSGALAFAACGWLAGRVSGKPFMEWSGAARWVFPAAMLLLAIVLAAGYAARLRVQPEARAWRAAKALLLAGLTCVPFVLFWAADPARYPPINPDSGGSTGGSLLGSTLGIVALFLACPLLVGLPPRPGRFPRFAAWVALAMHYAWFALLDHGARSHHEPAQVLALSSLLLWWPLLTLYVRRFTWPAAARPWLVGLGVWGAALLVTAVFAFLPGVLDRWKFTHVFVAHTHIAMAGLVTSFLMVVLVALNRRGAWADALARPWTVLAWQGGTVLHVLAMQGLGLFEAAQPASVYQAWPVTQAAFATRLIAGVAMTAASVAWLAGARRSRRERDDAPRHGVVPLPAMGGPV